MRIAQVAPMYEAVPPTYYGGTERVVWCLVEELVKQGHDVTLFASGDSRTGAKLVPTTPASLRQQMTREELENVAPFLHLAALGEIMPHAGELDIIHSHLDHLAFLFAKLVSTPIVTTLHGRLDLPIWPPILRRYPRMPLVSVSMSQREPLAALDLNWAGCVYNGVPLENYRFQPRAGEYLAFLGRIAPEKRPDWAAEIARRAGMPLKVAAKIDPVDEAYWHTEIEPIFRAGGVEFVGEVDEQGKAELLGGAAALLFPIDWPEPFGLVMAEALACGTPVIAMRRGSVPEVLQDGVSGFLCDTVDQMVAAVSRLGELSRHECRRQSLRFGAEAMAKGYLDVYTGLLAGRAPLVLPLACAPDDVAA